MAKDILLSNQRDIDLRASCPKPAVHEHNFCFHCGADLKKAVKPGGMVEAVVAILFWSILATGFLGWYFYMFFLRK
jgi:hypothetical protein